MTAAKLLVPGHPIVIFYNSTTLFSANPTWRAKFFSQKKKLSNDTSGIVG
ncbi:hypothetical protein M5X00_24155 [Paenibacillus alvei]|uniref:Uncharacterized protein n=1 Tax=Paenibacillus alvei TaxID=44250 RepID=A0ABT4GR26_PAEAL|nr:hypothetical protein [Paenibacillus alvei]MCY9757323.1 hypothetical protein [Paenibacillus alvei]MCY9759146.1 hypothetical protein [Paenibacillus alvei]MCY9770395.1 hypothetical protein [Paenibacillus alvei]